MELITKYAIKAFNEGSDNFGETATGEVVNLEYLEAFKQYTVTVKLKEKDGSTSTSSVGFKQRDNKFDVISGHVVFQIDNTPELQEELKLAEISEF